MPIIIAIHQQREAKNWDTRKTLVQPGFHRALRFVYFVSLVVGKNDSCIWYLKPIYNLVDTLSTPRSLTFSLTMSNDQQPNNPLHGVTLAAMLEHLVEAYGWEKLSRLINVRCFTNDPSIKSSLTFLRKTTWARNKVERLYLKTRLGNQK